MGKRSSLTTQEYLINAKLPEGTESYTVISHKAIIDKTKEALASKGFEVVQEYYRCNGDGSVAQGVYHLKYGEDPDMGLMFAWSNSYDKTMRFKCSIGGFVHNSLASVVGGNMGTFSRKHTGTADNEAFETIDEQINNAEAYFSQLISDKEAMKTITVDQKMRAELMGRIYFVHELVNSEQVSIVRQEFKRPSFVYSGVEGSLWHMYNAIIFALQKAHPRSWLDQQRMVHFFLCKEFSIQAMAPIKEAEVVTEAAPAVEPVPANQIDLEDSIREVEAETIKLEEKSEEVVQAPKKLKTATESDKAFSELEKAEVTGPDEFLPNMGVKDGSGIIPEVQVAEPSETIPNPSLEDQDGVWNCLECGIPQGPLAIFHDGQLCTECVNKHVTT